MRVTFKNQSDGYNLEKVGIMYVGAKIVESEHVLARRSGATPPFHTVTGQSLIHYYIPGETTKTPVLMLPGLGLSGYIFISTPDGRNSWAWDFSKAGYPCYIQTPAVQAMSGMDIKPFLDVSAEKSDISTLPNIVHYSNEICWKLWGFGEAMDKPYSDTQYPVENIIQFYSSFSPMIGGSDEVKKPDQHEVDNMIEMLEKTGQAIILAHSMSGTLAVEITKRRPDLIKAIVFIEPVGSPTDEAEIKEYFADKPYLAVYGDYIESRRQTGRLENCKITAELINNNGGNGKVIVLTEMGMKGNTHLMSQDKNSSEIAAMIIEWMDNNVK